MTRADTMRAGRSAEPPTVVAVIPAYNEERFIGSVVLKARRHASTVVVVDDGSTDATGEIARAAGALVLRHEQNQGKGVALNTGFQKAVHLDPAVIVTLDGDGQHVPDEIPCVLAPILQDQADIVVGSRYLKKECDVPRHRTLGHRFVTTLTNLISRVPVTDSQCGFRAFSPKVASAVTFTSDGFSVESEMQFLAQERGLRIVEAPVSALYEDRPKRPVVAHGLAVLNGILHLIGQYRPLLFFGVPGLVVLLVGLGWGAYVVDIYRRTQTLAVGYALVSLLLTILGSLSLFSGIILHSVRGLLLDLVRSGEAK